MGKTYKDSNDSQRDKTRDRAGWKADRKAARERKALARGEFVRGKLHRAVHVSDVAE